MGWGLDSEGLVPARLVFWPHVCCMTNSPLAILRVRVLTLGSLCVQGEGEGEGEG